MASATVLDLPAVPNDVQQFAAAPVSGQLLDASRQEPTRTQVTDAIRIYERDVLKEVTWHP